MGRSKIKLSDNFGKTNTLLLFFPMAFTGTCTTEMCNTSKELPSYSDMNAAVYGISGDNPFAQEAWAKKENISVPLLSDYEHKIAKQYDVMYDSFLPQMNLGMGGVPKRSAFIVDRERRHSIRREQRRRPRAAEFRQDQSEAGGDEVSDEFKTLKKVRCR